MGLQPIVGTLRKVPLPNLVRQCYLRKATGVLDMHHGKNQRRLFFFGGEIRSARSNRMEQKIGQFAVRAEAITQAQLLHALSTKKPETPLGAHLVALEFLPQELLDEQLEALVREIVFECFGWTEGDFKFYEGTPMLPAEVEIHVSTADLIFNGFKQFASRAHAEKAIGDLGAILSPNPNLRLLFQHVTLEPEEGFFLTRINGTASTEAMLQQMPGDKEENLILIASFVACGLVSVGAEAAVGSSMLDFFAEHMDIHPDVYSALAGARGSAARGGSRAGRPKAPPKPARKSLLRQDAKVKAKVEFSPKDIQLMRRNIQSKYQHLDRLDYYQLYELPRKATQKEVHFTFVNLGAFYHPDLALQEPFRDLKRQLEAVFERFEEAYNTLVDTERRKEYDRKLGYRF